MHFRNLGSHAPERALPLVNTDHKIAKIAEIAKIAKI